MYVIKTCSSFGNLKMDVNEGVQSFNFEVGQKFKSFKEFESQHKHYQDAKFIQMYRRSSCKIESTKTKQTMIWFSVNLNTHVFMEAKILFPIPKDQDQIRGKHLNFVFTNVVQYQGKHSTYPINDLYKTTLDRRRDK